MCCLERATGDSAISRDVVDPTGDKGCRQPWCRIAPTYLSQTCKGRDKLAEVIILWYPTSSRARVGLCVSTTVKYVFQAYIHIGYGWWFILCGACSVYK